MHAVDVVPVGHGPELRSVVDLVVALQLGVFPEGAFARAVFELELEGGAVVNEVEVNPEVVAASGVDLLFQGGPVADPDPHHRVAEVQLVVVVNADSVLHVHPSQFFGFGKALFSPA